MSTDRQKAVNKLNAQKSTGPTSITGKAKSALNHFSHGFTSSATIAPGEDPEEFKALLDALSAEYQPTTLTEQILVEQMAINQWLSLRAFRLQGLVFLGAKLGGGGPFTIPKDLALLIRYKTTADNAFHRAHNELVKTQKERTKSEIGFESQSPLDTPVPQPVQASNEPKIVPITPDEFVFSGEEIPATRENVQQALRFLKTAV